MIRTSLRRPMVAWSQFAVVLLILAFIMFIVIAFLLPNAVR